MKRKLQPFYTIIYNINSNKFEHYDVMSYLVECYKKAKKKKKQPNTFEEFKEFVKSNSMYMYWSRCEYEIVLVDFPCGKTRKKIDIHQQIMMNIDLVTETLMRNVV